MVQTKEVAVCFVVLCMGLIAVLTCAVAEITKTKVQDVRLDGRLCSLPASPAFVLGIVASACFIVAEIIGTSWMGWKLCVSTKNLNINAWSRSKITSLLIMSWMTAGVAVVLLAAGTSMNQGQKYGDGWVDGNCYVVKDGVYAAVAVMAMATISCMLAATFCIPTTNEKENKKSWERSTNDDQQLTIFSS